MELWSSDIKVKGLPLTKYLCQENYDKDRMSSELEEILDKKPVKGEALNKIAKSAPYNILQNNLIYEETDQRNSLTFSELLDDSLGELESSIIFSKIIDLQWIFYNYCLTKNGDKPLSLVYCQKTDCLTEADKQILQEKSNIKIVNFSYTVAFGFHNTKLMVLKYTDESIRVAVITGSFTQSSWEKRTIMLWVSNKLPVISPIDSGNGDSVTNFKKDLLRYLKSYNTEELSAWISTVENVNFESVNVFFVSSIPGDYELDYIAQNPIGHPALRRILSKYSAPINDNCPIVAQTRVLSKCGRESTSSANFMREIACTFVQDSSGLKIRRTPDYKIVMTSFKNFQNSFHIDYSGVYKTHVHNFQYWINDYLYHWQGHTTERTKALHLIKSYARWSDDGLYWFLFGSQNLTRAGFGSYNWIEHSSVPFKLTNYEVGILFLPRIIIGKDYFPMNKDQQEEGDTIFPLPYQVPLTPYEPDDKPFCVV